MQPLHGGPVEGFPSASPVVVAPEKQQSQNCFVDTVAVDFHDGLPKVG
jgi:hypothetical protein